MKYFVYVRKSSEEEERQALSLQSQIDKATEMFEHLDFEVLPPESASAFKPNNRPVFEHMLKRIDAGEAHGIIAWHPDRLSRNEIDAAAVTYRLRSGAILDLKFGSFTFDNSPEGMMMLQMTMSQSQYFSAKLSKDVKRGLERKITLGQKPGSAPIGYINTPDRLKGTREIIADPERFELVRRMWDLMLTGNYSVPKVRKVALTEWGLRTRKTRNGGDVPLSLAATYGMFKNVFYTGKFIHNGVEHQGTHPSMVTDAEYSLVQQLLGSKGNPRPKTHDFAYRGPITCGECNCMVTAESKSKYIKSTGITRQYTYYHCTHKKPCKQTRSITETVLEEQVDELLGGMTIMPAFKDWALEVLRTSTDSEIQQRTKIHESLNRAVESTQKQLDSLTKMRIRELIDDAEFIEQKESLSREISGLREQLRDTEGRADKWLELAERTFDFAANARQQFADGDAATRRNIFKALGTSYVLMDGQLLVEPHAWFKPIQNNYPVLQRQFNEVRTDDSLSSRSKKAAYAAINTNWLRRLGSNQ